MSMSSGPSRSTEERPAPEPITIEHELGVLDRARRAVEAKLARMAAIKGGGADTLADEYIASVVAGAVETLGRELVVFGRVDEPASAADPASAAKPGSAAEPGRAWRIGLYGIDEDYEQLVVDWRAPFAEGFYQANFSDPRGLDRRVAYVGSIADLLIEDFTSGAVSGTSPLLAELSRRRGEAMRTSVATLQAEQDALVRLDPDERLVLRGGPGTGKTVVGLHRAAWLVYNDNRLTADRLLVIGPSDRFLAYVAAVLPTLGEARVHQTTFERLLGPVTVAGSDPQWIEFFDRFEEQLLRPQSFKVGARTIPESEVIDLLDRMGSLRLPWRDRRSRFVDAVARSRDLAPTEVSKAAKSVFPSLTFNQAVRQLRRRPTLASLGVDRELIDAWLAEEADGAWLDELRARIEGVPARYSHVIVDEAQDLSLLQLRAVQRRAKGLTMVGDDAQRSAPWSLGLHQIGVTLETEPVEMRTAYRMSAEIAEWLNELARSHDLDAVELDGIRPTGIAVREVADAEAAERDLRTRWDTVASIGAGEVWQHKGVEYDAVVLRTTGLSPAERYLGASRAAHELLLAA